MIYLSVFISLLITAGPAVFLAVKAVKWELARYRSARAGWLELAAFVAAAVIGAYLLAWCAARSADLLLINLPQWIGQP